jgi:NodT family efflux transporter outer membrane factor (OMF) lipoprotein
LKRPLALLLAAACAGCTVGPDFSRPGSAGSGSLRTGPPARHRDRSSPDRDLPAEWWTLFGSPELDALVRRALAHSPTLDQARAVSSRRASLRAARAGATELPSINATGGVVRQRIDPATVGFPQAPNPGPFTVYSVGADVSYAFDIFGGTRRELEGLAAQVDYQAYELEAARLSLAANVVTTAINLAAMRAQLESTEAILAAQANTLSIAEKRYAAGGVAEVEVRNQQALVAETRAALPPLQAQRDRAIHLLAIYAGDAPAARADSIVRLADIRTPPAIPLRLPSELVRQRPIFARARRCCTRRAPISASRPPICIRSCRSREACRRAS